MEKLYDERVFKNAELLSRLPLIVSMLVAGISKFCSHGAFRQYYATQFANPALRIQLPHFLFDSYLALIPFIEIILGLGLIYNRTRRIFTAAWIVYILSLVVGHYVMEEWLAVDAVLMLTLLGVVNYLLPTFSFPRRNAA